jgi:hemerythrin-like metal-binding protein
MYYSYFSTGNVRIDSEHANIDCMIDLCRSREGEWVPSARVLISALANHFDSEEMIAREDGLNMTPEHLQEHKQLKSRLAVLDKQVASGDVDKGDFLDSLRDTLFYHISNFDKHLKAE